jgi:hypothetical protein
MVMTEKRTESKLQSGGAGSEYPQSSAMVSSTDLTDLIRRLAQQGGIPITLAAAPPVSVDTGKLLSDSPRRTVAFPPCADELLALIRTNQTDEITGFFREYFRFDRHRIFGQRVRGGSPPQLEDLDSQLRANLDPALLGCGETQILSGGPIDDIEWPSECCICSSCVTLDGNRNRLGRTDTTVSVEPRIKRLFLGDVIWLFYFEQMGIFQILGVILDAFATNGRIPISNGAINVGGVRDDITALVLEVMVRQTKMGLSSTVRDRSGAYRTCLGWNSTTGRKLQLDTEVNTGFNTLFHQFIYQALDFFNVRRMATAIRGSAAPAAPASVGTLTTISDTLEVLKKRLEVFDYGRNYYNTLSGIVWAISGMSMIRELSTTLGIPPAYDDPHEFIPAAYDLLVLKRPVTSGAANRYLVHRDCAQNGRDILLDIEVINHRDTRQPGGDLDNWLTQVEGKVEAYRTAYRTLTGVDLGARGNPVIEQQA